MWSRPKQCAVLDWRLSHDKSRLLPSWCPVCSAWPFSKPQREAFLRVTLGMAWFHGQQIALGGRGSRERAHVLRTFIHYTYVRTYIHAYIHALARAHARAYVHAYIKVCLDACLSVGLSGMDGWMDGWMGAWMHGWMDGWMGGWVDGYMDTWMAWHGWMDGWMGAWMHGCMDGWMNECMNA